MGLPARDLHDEIDELQERIRQLEDMLSGPTGEFGWAHLAALSRQQQRIFNCLMRHDYPSKEMLHQAAQRPDGLEYSGPTVVNVQICRMRPALKEIGVTIHCKYGRGHYITPEDKEKVRRHVEQRSRA